MEDRIRPVNHALDVRHVRQERRVWALRSREEKVPYEVPTLDLGVLIGTGMSGDFAYSLLFVFCDAGVVERRRRALACRGLDMRIPFPSGLYSAPGENNATGRAMHDLVVRPFE